MQISQLLMKEFNLKAFQVDNTLKLMEEGNTIPFIARYRKELTGGLSDEILRDLSDRLTYLKNLMERKDQVIRLIEDQGKLTDDLRTKIEEAESLIKVEDLYLPYKQKRRTRGTMAREKGLLTLAETIYQQESKTPLAKLALAYVNEEKGVNNLEEAIQGAQDIIAENIADDAAIRDLLREFIYKNSYIKTQGKGQEEESIYKMYYDFREKISAIPGHRILAINRGENQKELSVKLEFDTEYIVDRIARRLIKDAEGPYVDTIVEAIEDSYKRLLYPSIEREIRNGLTEKAGEQAIKVFAKNLDQLLMQPPISGKIVLALDPAFRTGCKLAVLDKYGNVLDTDVIYPTPPQNKIDQALKTLDLYINKHQVNLIAIGNGTASRETEAFVVEYLSKKNKGKDEKIKYIIVNEAGASVYSASKLASEEFPEYDPALRSAISIGRRLQDPLSELVKIEAKAIGVGQYQHDMNQNRLAEVLGAVVEDSVNKVGVDLNTASPTLLQYVSGISKNLANNIVKYREKNGIYENRKDLLKVPKLGPKTFKQAAGFLRIKNGTEKLDNTAVHPESYPVAKKLLKNLQIERLNEEAFKKAIREAGPIANLAKDLAIGEPTLKDIIYELEKPGRDPREDMPQPILRTDVLSLDDIEVGMILQGTVRNVIDFGAFVDIGVHQDGLIHISKLSDKYIKHPLEVVSIGDIVDVEIISLDKSSNRIGMKLIR